MSTLAGRMAVALSMRHGTQAELARHCKVAPASANNWLSGETKTLKSETAIKAAEYLRVNVEWLSTGRGQMLRQGGNETPPPFDLSAIPSSELLAELARRLGN